MKEEHLTILTLDQVILNIRVKVLTEYPELSNSFECQLRSVEQKCNDELRRHIKSFMPKMPLYEEGFDIMKSTVLKDFVPTMTFYKKKKLFLWLKIQTGKKQEKKQESCYKTATPFPCLFSAN